MGKVIGTAGLMATLLWMMAGCGTKVDPVNFVAEPEIISVSDTNCTVDLVDLYMEIPIGNPGHTEDHGGILHKPGGFEPFANCVSCHGEKLKGGVGPSCYSCHNNIDHPGHNEDHNGTWHKVGSADPLANCVACHGAQLKGGFGLTCYSCHNNDDHLSNHDGVMHQRGTNTSCAKCHGPGNKGGLGPTCLKCHNTTNPVDD